MAVHEDSKENKEELKLFDTNIKWKTDGKESLGLPDKLEIPAECGRRATSKRRPTGCRTSLAFYAEDSQSKATS